MKKLLLIPLIALAAAACQNGTPIATIDAQLDSLANDTMVVRLYQADRRQVERTDTVVATGGKLHYRAAIAEARTCVISTIDGADGRGVVYLFPGVTLNLQGRLGKCPMKGAPVYDELEQIQNLTAEENARKGELMMEAQQLHMEGRDDEIDARIAPLFNLQDSIANAKIKDYIAQHPTTNAAVYLLANEIGYEDFATYDSIIAPEAKVGLMAGFYNAAREQWERENQRRENLKKLDPGMPAPDFTLPSIDGTPLTLSDLRGKYVVIDFWGSWCGWCIKGMPDMKDYYARYGDRLEILGVDCGDKEEAWRAAVEKHELPWRHVRNDDAETDVTTLYAIEGYPTKAVIDPEGNIVRIIVGESPEFYALLDSLLGK